MMKTTPRIPAHAMLDVDAATRYILSRECRQGGYSFYRTPEWGVEEPNARDTLAALDSLLRLGVTPPQPERTLSWLQTLQYENGSWATITIAWAACKALALFGMQPKHDPSAWIHELWESRAATVENGADRDWRGTIIELYQLMQLTRLHASDISSKLHRDLARFLNASRTRDGVWAKPGADLETTGFAIETARLGGLELADASVAAWWRQCEDPILGLRLTPSAGTTSTVALWAGLELGARLGIAARYPAAIATQLRLLQHPSGGFSYRHKALPTLWDTWYGIKAACLLDGGPPD
ncbi:hypothetical protein [Candidatus Igneacidithiobacillus taiwanensis]|uniref:hypothetical protein n=1 Tax=Candidatus Igneacidithiobacillus taiwanensis TaxID=1945924 RepID=UPI00289ED2F1|nr:hypothetical protein [Candidatus Igneacidithiobacillus taiwanensis]